MPDEQTSGTDEQNVTAPVSGGKTKTKQKPATETATQNVETESAVVQQPKRRCMMYTSQAGFNTEVRDGKKVNTTEFVRLPGKEYDIDADEAERLVESGQAQYV